MEKEKVIQFFKWGKSPREKAENKKRELESQGFEVYIVEKIFTILVIYK